MKFKRIGRVLVCLLLVSALLINASPIKAKATGIGATAAITAASTVLSPAGLVVGATFVALGLAAAANPEGFQNVVDAGVSALESAGTWVKDGMVELLRTVDADGNASYYVDSGMMEDVRTWSFESDTIYYNGHRATNTLESLGTLSYSSALAYASECENCFTFEYGDSRGVCAFEGGSACYQFSNGSLRVYNSYTFVRYWNPDTGVFKDWSKAYDFARSGAVCITTAEQVSTNSNISLGVIPSVPVDGSSARQWSEEYTDRGLKVYGGGSGNNNNDGKWFWPLALTLTAAELYAMSQADEWSGQTPQEFDDYTNKTEYEILSQPEIEFGHGIEIRPVTSPTPDSGGGTDPTQPGEGDNPGESTQPTTPGGLPDIGGGDNPDPGGDGNTGTESGNQIDYTNWFERIIKGIEELPSKFAEWFNNIATQLERIIEGITTLGQNFAQNLQTLGQNIVEGIRNAISSLFSPSENYLENKVQALKDKHYNLAQFTELGNNLKAFFAGLGSKPPIIYIDLGAATGSYLWGGRQIFLDLTWYAEYKPKMDFILGGIIWLWLAWRVFLAIPGIISGMPGESGSPDISIGTHYIPPIPGQGALPPGQKKRRSK